MTKVTSIFFCSVLGGILVVGAGPVPFVPSALAFEPVHQSLIVKVKKNRKNDDDDDKPKTFNCKKAKCDPGEVKLDKPNIYGACCQATAAPLTPKPKAAEPEKCKFPGEVGEPPNCTCPPPTEFMGYKGCKEPYCCTSYGDASDGGGSIKACGEHGEAQAKVTSHLFNGHPPARFECYPK